MSATGGWLAVDLDGTLAVYNGWNGGKIGAPIPLMVNRVKRWLAEGYEVRIFTARVCGHGLPLIGGGKADVLTPIKGVVPGAHRSGTARDQRERLQHDYPLR